MATLISSKSYSSFMAAVILLLGFFAANLDLKGAESVGVSYGMLGNNLPSAWEVVELFKSHNIRLMRLYDPYNQEALQALRGSNIEVTLGVPNKDLESLANPSNAQSWVQQNVLTYWPSVRFRHIAVGNEVSPVDAATARYAQFVLPALVNVFNAVRSAGLRDQIQISTAIGMNLLGNSYPPSAGAFRGDVRSYLDPIIGHLAWASAPLLANIYPYFSYASNPKDISLDYALFTSPSPVVWDQGRGYQNLFDAILDALYSALENAGQGSLRVVTSESGWPSQGGFGTGHRHHIARNCSCATSNAGIYLSNLIRHVQGGKGTPKRPGTAIETYLFALFDENQKEPELEKHFGLFYPNKEAKYPLNFS